MPILTFFVNMVVAIFFACESDTSVIKTHNRMNLRDISQRQDYRVGLPFTFVTCIP